MLKMLFCSMTFMIIALYSARIIWLLVVQNANIWRFSGETVCSFLLLILLASFDDPLYYFHVDNPNLFSYVFSEFCVATFVAGLLIHWLRSIARHRSKELEPEATRMMKFLHKSMIVGKKTTIFLVVLYLVMVIAFTILNCAFFYTVEGNPGAGALSIN